MLTRVHKDFRVVRGKIQRCFRLQGNSQPYVRADKHTYFSFFLARHRKHILYLFYDTFSIIGIIVVRSILKESEDAIVKTGLVASIFGFLFNIVTFTFFLIFFR